MRNILIITIIFLSNIGLSFAQTDVLNAYPKSLTEIPFRDNQEVTFIGIIGDQVYFRNGFSLGSLYIQDGIFMHFDRKQLKKLPKIKLSHIEQLKNELQARFITKQQEIRKEALDKKIVKNALCYASTTQTSLSEGQECSIIGYNYNDRTNTHRFAIISNNILGDYTNPTMKKVFDIPDSILVCLPSIDDPAVVEMINEFKGKREARWKHIKDSINAESQLKKQQAEQEKIKKEEERMSSLKEECSNKCKNGEYITITSCYLTQDSKGRLIPTIYYKNNSTKVIKYVYFNVKFKNAVNDFVCNELMSTTRNQYSESLKDTGPIPPTYEAKQNAEYGGSWDIGYYNYSARSVYFTNIKIIFMDGSSVTSNVKIANQQVKVDDSLY